MSIPSVSLPSASLRSVSNLLTIGDIHFRAKEVREGNEYIEAVVFVAAEEKPDAIILLGDTLDTHEIVRIGPFLQATRLIDRLRAIAPVFILMGNHDLRSGAMYLSAEHAFAPFKEWKNVTVVDTPIIVSFDGVKVGMVPYVPPGRFGEALSTLGETDDEPAFTACQVILAHQEFLGADLGGTLSTEGDAWSPDYPPVISGHIHTEQRLDSGVYYIGSSRQTSFGDEDIKSIARVKVTDEGMSLSTIPLPLRGKKTLRIPVEDITPETFDRLVPPDMLSRFNLRLVISGREEALSAFKKSPFFRALKMRDPLNLSVVLSPASVPVTFDEEEVDESVPHRTYDDVLRELIEHESAEVQELAREMALVS